MTVFADLKQVAVYSVYHLISYSLRNVVTSFGSGMEAMFGDMIARNEMEELAKAYRRYKLILTLLTLTLFGAAMVLILPFIKLYTASVTDANYYVPVFAALLCIAYTLYCFRLPFNPLKDPKLTGISASLNETVLRLAEEKGLPVIDLFDPMDVLDREEFWSDTYHFRAPAIEMQAKIISDHVLTQLEL